MQRLGDLDCKLYLSKQRFLGHIVRFGWWLRRRRVLGALQWP